MRYRKSNVTRRYYDGQLRPVVNVKVNVGSPLPHPDFPGLTAEKAERIDRDGGWYETARSLGYERARDLARETWGPNVTVYSAGRSGGWLYVEGLPDFESWNAVDVSRWARFERACEAEAEDVPYLWADLIYHNVYEPEHAEDEDVDAETIRAAAELEGRF